jgi:hypothetical protein
MTARRIKYRVLLGTEGTYKVQETFLDDCVFKPGEEFVMREILPLDWPTIWKEVDAFEVEVKDVNKMDNEDIEAIRKMRREKIQELVENHLGFATAHRRG